MKAAILFSGGKDCSLALHKAKEKGYDIQYLLTINPESFDSFMFHKPYLNLLRKQSEMLGSNLIVLKSKNEKEKELDDLKKLIGGIKSEIDMIVVGGIASNYQSKRIKKICKEFNLKFYAPFWKFENEKIWEELFKQNFKIILTKIACEGLGKEWLGKIITKENFKELRKLSEKYGFRIDFEGGEAETAVLYMPEFKKEIKINFNIKSEGKYRHFINRLIIK